MSIYLWSQYAQNIQIPPELNGKVRPICFDHPNVREFLASRGITINKLPCVVARNGGQVLQYEGHSAFEWIQYYATQVRESSMMNRSQHGNLSPQSPDPNGIPQIVPQGLVSGHDPEDESGIKFEMAPLKNPHSSSDTSEEERERKEPIPRVNETFPSGVTPVSRLQPEPPVRRGDIDEYKNVNPPSSHRNPQQRRLTPAQQEFQKILEKAKIQAALHEDDQPTSSSS